MPPLLIDAGFKETFVTRQDQYGGRVLPVVIRPAGRTGGYQFETATVWAYRAVLRVETATRVPVFHVVGERIIIAAAGLFPSELLVDVTRCDLGVIITRIRYVVSRPLRSVNMPFLVLRFHASFVAVPVKLQANEQDVVLLLRIVMVR